MVTKIAVTAGEIWLELDKSEGLYFEELVGRLESPERSRDLILMAFGWLVYQQYVKWTPGEKGGALRLVSAETEEGPRNEKSDQNDFAAHHA